MKKESYPQERSRERSIAPLRAPMDNSLPYCLSTLTGANKCHGMTVVVTHVLSEIRNPRLRCSVF